MQRQDKGKREFGVFCQKWKCGLAGLSWAKWWVTPELMLGCRQMGYQTPGSWGTSQESKPTTFLWRLLYRHVLSQIAFVQVKREDVFTLTSCLLSISKWFALVSKVDNLLLLLPAFLINLSSYPPIYAQFPPPEPAIRPCWSIGSSLSNLKLFYSWRKYHLWVLRAWGQEIEVLQDNWSVWGQRELGNKTVQGKLTLTSVIFCLSLPISMEKANGSYAPLFKGHCVSSSLP